MGAAWSRWWEEAPPFRKAQYLDPEGDVGAFYAAMRRAVGVVEAQEEAAPSSDDVRIQVQYVLENWAREVGIVYDRIGDFPLILPVPQEPEMPPSSDAGPMELDAGSSPSPPPPRSQEERALKSACADPFATSERIHQATQRLTERVESPELLHATLARYPPALRLYVTQRVHAECDALAALQAIEAARQDQKAAMFVGQLAYGEESFVKRRRRLLEMTRRLERAEAASSTTTGTLAESSPSSSRARKQSQSSFYRVMTDEMIALVDVQNALENRLAVVHLVGGSLIETIQKLVTMFPTHSHALSSAVDLAQQFAVPPRQFWWTLLRILPQTDQWRTLLLLAGAVPPPFGYVPVAEVLIQEQRQDLAQELLASVRSSDDRAEVVAYLAAQSQAPPPAESDI